MRRRGLLRGSRDRGPVRAVRARRTNIAGQRASRSPLLCHHPRWWRLRARQPHVPRLPSRAAVPCAAFHGLRGLVAARTGAHPRPLVVSARWRRLAPPA